MSYFNKLLSSFSKLNERIGNKKLLVSVRRGLTFMIPSVLIGSIALVIISLPIPAYQNLMMSIFGDGWKDIPLYIRDGTFNILSIIMVICVSYSHILEYKECHSLNINPIIAASVSLACFITLSGLGKTGFNIQNFGVIGIFVAIITAISSSWIFLKLSTINFLKIKAFTDGANSAFNYTLSSIYPAAITITLFAAINHALTALFGIDNIQSFISDVLNSIFSNIKSPVLCSVFFIALIHIFWFFGMHGSNILEPVAQSIFIPAITVNQALILNNSEPAKIFTKTFFDTFILMGGCGSALCLVIAILIKGRSKNQRKLAKLSLIPVFFNINELIVFGIPIVLNPIFMIPFLFVPLLFLLTSYLATFLGLVPHTINPVEWTTPIFLSGYYSTNSINGSILQLFNLILGVLCYIPFVKIAQEVSEKQIKNNINKVYDYFRQNEERGTGSLLLDRYDDIGSISRFMAVDLEHDLNNQKVSLFYQPQVNYKGEIIGVEALLRWNHDLYGYIYPPFIIALAVEAKLDNKLDYWILDTACRDLKKLNDMGYDNLSMSVNITVFQLENDKLLENINEIINKYQIDPKKLKFEITEQVALRSSKKILYHIQAIKKTGIKLEMDDFGMGHSSLLYLKEYQFDTIKLDGSLVRDIITNKSGRNIISSIVDLGKTLGYSVLAEFVETSEQREILHELGCNQYQGYLYSKAIPYDELVDYIEKHEYQTKLRLLG